MIFAHLGAISSLKGLRGITGMPRCSAFPVEKDFSHSTPFGDVVAREMFLPASEPSTRVVCSISWCALFLRCLLRKENALPHNLRDEQSNEASPAVVLRLRSMEALPRRC